MSESGDGGGDERRRGSRRGECFLVSVSAILSLFVFFFNDTATTEIYTLSLHDALPIWTPNAPKDPWICELNI